MPSKEREPLMTITRIGNPLTHPWTDGKVYYIMETRSTGYIVDTDRPIRPLYTSVSNPSFGMAGLLASTPILDQGNTSACTGMAAKTMVDIAAIGQRKKFRASARGLYTLARYAIFSPGEPLQDAGAHFRSIFDQAQSFGLIHEADCPWEADRINEDIGFDSVIAGQGERMPVDGWYSLDDTGDDRLRSIKLAILQGYAVGGAWAVTKDFCKLGSGVFVPISSGGAVRYAHERDTSDFAGNHAMAITGYSHSADGKRCWFRIQNSWGEGFANKGICWFDEEYIQEAWDLTVVKVAP